MSNPFDPNEWRTVASGTPEGQEELTRDAALVYVSGPLISIVQALFNFGVLAIGKVWRTQIFTPSQRITVTISVEDRAGEGGQ